ncbi:hypothetical protein CLOM_g12637 [Closterium sp. NIES-68]|nr:hypothetical protein CLOM_g12637 [Closterium sp. NIES-68]GJP68587.1 hypothetical protein CLOP_g25267 [Closterium sp. NIES-67]
MQGSGGTQGSSGMQASSGMQGSSGILPKSQPASQGPSARNTALPSPSTRLCPGPSLSPHPAPSPPTAIPPGLDRGVVTSPPAAGGVVGAAVPELLQPSPPTREVVGAAVPETQPSPPTRSTRSVAGAAPAPKSKCQPSSPTPVPSMRQPLSSPTSGVAGPAEAGRQPLSPTPQAGWQPSSPTPVRSPHAQLIQRRAAEARARQAQMDEAWGALLAQETACATPGRGEGEAGGSNLNLREARPTTPTSRSTPSTPSTPSTSANPVTWTAASTPPTRTAMFGGGPAAGESSAGYFSPRQQVVLPQILPLSGTRATWGASWRHLLASGRSLKGWSSSFAAVNEGESGEEAASPRGLARGVVTAAEGSSRRGLCRSMSLTDSLQAAAAAASIAGTEANAAQELSTRWPCGPKPHAFLKLSIPSSLESTPETRACTHPAFQQPPALGADRTPLRTMSRAGGIFTGTRTLIRTLSGSIKTLIDDKNTKADSPIGNSTAQGSSPEYSIYSCALPSLPSPEAADSASQSAPLRENLGNPHRRLYRRGTPRIVSSSSCSDLHHLHHLQHLQHLKQLQAAPQAALHHTGATPPHTESSPARVSSCSDLQQLQAAAPLHAAHQQAAAISPRADSSSWKNASRLHRGSALRVASSSCSDLQELQAPPPPALPPAPPTAPPPALPTSPPTASPTAPPTAPPTMRLTAAMPPRADSSPAAGPSKHPGSPQRRNTLRGISSSCSNLQQLQQLQEVQLLPGVQAVQQPQPQELHAVQQARQLQQVQGVAFESTQKGTSSSCSDLQQLQEAAALCERDARIMLLPRPYRADSSPSPSPAGAALTHASLPIRTVSSSVLSCERDAARIMLPLARRPPADSSPSSSPAAALTRASLPVRSLSSSVLSCSSPMLSSLAKKGEKGSRAQHQRKVSFNSTVRVRTFASMHDIEAAYETAPAGPAAAAPAACCT